jgi:regulator of replication initiation timing
MEKTVTETTDKGTVQNVSTELQGAEIRDNIESHNEGVKFEPLFESESISEAALMGEDEAATGEQKADPGPTGDAETKNAGADDAAKKAADEAKAKGDAEAKKKADAEKASLPKEVLEDLKNKEEHISGLTTAVSQARQNVKILKQEIQRLSAENAQLKTPRDVTSKEAEKFKDFKVLSDDEYENLVNADPDGATRYLYRLNKYNEHQNKVSAEKANAAKAQGAEKEIVNYGIQELERVLPGITQGKNEMATKLTEFAMKHGVDDAVLAVLTDPRTKVRTPQGEDLLIGDGAAQLVALIKSTYEALANVPNRETIEAELRPKIEQEMADKIIKKLKQNPSGGYKSLDQIAGSGSKDVKPIGGFLTEADIARLSDDDLRSALGG